MFFQSPPPSPYDLNFSLFSFPIRVHPLFWVMALLFGINLPLTLIPVWVAVVFISILVHELGHALAMRRFGEEAAIVLHLAGGLAISRGGRWGASRSGNEQIIISLAGPIAGFLLAATVLLIVWALGGIINIDLLFGFIPIPQASLPGSGSFINGLIQISLWINVFWGLINLAPIYPLDGGQVARELFNKADPWDGVRKSLWLSIGTGVVLAIAGVVFLGSLYMAFLFGILAFQNYQMLQGRV